MDWVCISIVLVLVGRRRSRCLGILVLWVVNLVLGWLHLWRLHVRLLLRTLGYVLMGWGLRILGLCRRSWLCGRRCIGWLRVCLNHFMSRSTTR